MQSFCENKSIISSSFKSKFVILFFDCLLDAGLKICRRRSSFNILIIDDIKTLCAVFSLAQMISYIVTFFDKATTKKCRSQYNVIVLRKKSLLNMK